MPYKKKSDLPTKVKNNITKLGKSIYQKAFNNAYEEYKDPKKRNDDSSREETAHKVAWAAIKKNDEKKNGKSSSTKAKNSSTNKKTNTSKSSSKSLSKANSRGKKTGGNKSSKKSTKGVKKS